MRKKKRGTPKYPIGIAANKKKKARMALATAKTARSKEEKEARAARKRADKAHSLVIKLERSHGNARVRKHKSAARKRK